MFVSSCRYICVLRAMRAEKSVGRAMASSSALVCNDCVCPIAADMASITVRPTLLKGSCSVSDHPDVWQCVRSAIDFGFLGLKLFIIFAHSMRAARIFAISMNGFMPIPQKNDRRGAKASMSIPEFTPVRTYSKPSARV